MTPKLAPELVRWHAAHAPDAVAVIDADGTLTYGRLVDRAARLAAAIRTAGVDPDQVVGLTGPRCADGIVAMFGILLAGAGYVYLDPTWPPERLYQVVAECRLRLVIGELPGLDTPTLTTVAEPSGAVPGPPDLPAGRADELCYVVYTSGSTGRPKGVAVEHGGVANMAVELARLFGVTPDSRVLQFAAWSWDAAVCEIMVALTAGATLVVAPDCVRHGGDALAAHLREHQVTVATLTPSLLAALPHDELPDLVTVVAVGEECPPDLVARWAAGRRMLNGYGPTETTVAVTVGRCERGQPVTIGRPIPGVTVRIVDDAGRPATTGELLVGGAGVARGYLADPGVDPRPVVTPGDRFVMEPDGSRWYRTGDLVRDPGEGGLLYLGRRDDQVQVHGHRIELGEVTAALHRQPEVRAATVVVTGGRLVAYVLAGDPGLRPVDVREAAARWLPPHMLPEVHLVDRLPLTAHGKLNRAALVQRPGPDTLLTRVLERVRAVLESDSIGPDDDLFDAGGHSLLAAQLAVDLDTHFGVAVTAADVAGCRTATRLAALLAPAPAGDAGPVPPGAGDAGLALAGDSG